MLQLLHAVLGTPGDSTARVALLYGSQTALDVLARDTLEAWAAGSQGRFAVTHGTSKPQLLRRHAILTCLAGQLCG